MSEDRLNQRAITEAHRSACNGCKNGITTTLDIVRKDRTVFDFNPIILYVYTGP